MENGGIGAEKGQNVDDWLKFFSGKLIGKLSDRVAKTVCVGWIYTFELSFGILRVSFGGTETPIKQKYASRSAYCIFLILIQEPIYWEK